jgi:hypothetical protein
MLAAGCGPSSAGDSNAACDGSACEADGSGSTRGDSSIGGGRDARADSPPEAGPASCTFDGKKVASGSSVTAYEASSVEPGNLCVSESRSCTDGTLGGTYAYASCTVTTVPAFYVSPSGSDADPGTIAKPFLTLGKAQAAMQSSMTVKTTYLRAGTYMLAASPAKSNCYQGGTAAIDLGAADDSETWSYYPPDGLASAVLDGGSTSATTGVACAFAANAASNLTFIGLEFQRLQYSAIYANASPNLVASDNTIHDLTVAVFNVGGVALHASSGTTVKNNYIHDVAYMGVGAWGGGMSNTTITGNVILNSCMAPAQPGGDDQDGGDCGAIYTWDESHVSTNIVISNNYVRDVNVSSNGKGDYDGCCATGIYVDDGMSNVTASGNVVTGIKSQCFVIHGGNDNTYMDNVCDLDDSMYQRIMTYQWDSLKLPMTGNSIENNIIVTGSASGGTGYSDDGTPTAPTIKDNAYFNYTGSFTDSSGPNGSDVNPTYENPDISCWDPSISSKSPVSAAPVSFKKLVGGWGPPGFVMPHTGTPPSWPHGC